jgi:hypothetical protein
MLLDNDHCKGPEWGMLAELHDTSQQLATTRTYTHTQTHTRMQEINAARCQNPRGMNTHRKVELLCIATQWCWKA